MSQKLKYCLVAVVTAIVTAMAMCCIMFYALGGSAAKAVDYLRFIMTAQFVESKFVDNVTTETLINGAIDGLRLAIGIECIALLVVADASIVDADFASTRV